ncbi:hypothetical protein ACH4S8_35850 [Streptomyces sp. NPDC021080]|uniref:hypothetical protein n=1 Tax=Streptomyces sp. NPDC021080 TaxID=3365110 RepID=UPI0037ABC2B0
MRPVNQAPPGPRAGHPVVRGSFRRLRARPDTARPAPPTPPVARPARSAAGPPSARRRTAGEGLCARCGPPASAVAPDTVPYPPVPEADRASKTTEAHQAPKTAAADPAAEETS